MKTMGRGQMTSIGTLRPVQCPLACPLDGGSRLFLAGGCLSGGADGMGSAWDGHFAPREGGIAIAVPSLTHAGAKACAHPLRPI